MDDEDENYDNFVRLTTIYSQNSIDNFLEQCEGQVMYLTFPSTCTLVISNMSLWPNDRRTRIITTCKYISFCILNFGDILIN